MKKFRFYKAANEENYQNIRDFLQECWRSTDDKTLNWPVSRLDYNRWHLFKNCYETELLDYIYILELDKKIIAVFIADCLYGYHFQVHPHHYEEEIFAALFIHFETVVGNSNHFKEIHIAAPVDDTIFENALSKAGFNSSNWIEVRRELVFKDKTLSVNLPSGFKIRELGSDELPARSWASWRAFHPDDPDENYEGWSWYKNIKHCPLYREELDLVCIDEKGVIAGFVTMWYEAKNQIGYIDPVGVIPEYWQKGIGKAVVTESLIRIKKMGAQRAYVESYENPAHRLYESIGLKAVKSLRTWKRILRK